MIWRWMCINILSVATTIIYTDYDLIYITILKFQNAIIWLFSKSIFRAAVGVNNRILARATLKYSSDKQINA